MYKLCLALSIAALAVACDSKTSDSAKPCQDIQIGVPFDAKIHDTWCLPAEGLEITFSSVVEDSRCNIDGIDCVWAGRTVLALQVDKSGQNPYADTIYTDESWQGSIELSQYGLFLKKVYPVTRASFETDTTDYHFEMILE